jgi:photosystem II stability/assembly factor-like uncharacterized protein
VILTLVTAVWSASASPKRAARLAVASSRNSQHTRLATSASTLPSATAPASPLPLVHTASTWQVSASYPAVSGVSEIACPSTSVCYAAGTDSSKAGDVLRTSDTGIRWRSETLPSGVDGITGISCPSVSACFATEGGSILMTHDSGTTWKRPNIPQGSNVVSIACPSVVRCYAAGTIDDEGPSVLETTDSGSRWTSQTVPPALGDAAFAVGGLTDIACPSTSVCYAVSEDGDYVVSTDSGSDWTIGQGSDDGSVVEGGGGLNPYGDAITCPSTTMCVTNGTSKNLGPDSIPTGILVTADSGRTWISERTPLLMGVFGVSCPSTRVCFAIGAGGIGSHEFGAVISSTDGGRSWRTSLDTPGPQYLGEITCPATTTCLGGDEGGSSLKVTTDSGGTWTTRTFPSGMAALQEVTCPSTAVCYATAANGILATDDAGSTWELRTLPSNSSPVAISCPSLTACYAIAQTGNRQREFLATADSGHSWTIVSELSAVSGLMPSELACPSTTTCYTVANADIGETTNSGRTWRIALGADAGYRGLDSISCPSISACHVTGTLAVVAGYSGVVATTDSGVTWSGQTVPDGTKPVLTGVACTSPAVCVAVGQDANCFKEGDDPCPTGTLAVVATDNGGNDWSGYTIPADINLNAVACLSNGHCFAVAFVGAADGYNGDGEGAILASGDSGMTWSSQAVPPATGDLTSISCPSATTCYAVGEGTGDVGGLILKASL